MLAEMLIYYNINRVLKGFLAINSLFENNESYDDMAIMIMKTPVNDYIINHKTYPKEHIYVIIFLFTFFFFVKSC